MRLWWVPYALFLVTLSNCKDSEDPADRGPGDPSGDLPDCDPSKPPYLDIENGCDFDFTLDNSPLVSGSCGPPGGVSSGVRDSQLLLQLRSGAGEVPYELLSFSLQAEGKWEDFEGFDSASDESPTVLATLEYMRAATMPTFENVGELSEGEEFVNVVSTDCFVNTDPAATGADPLVLRVDSVEAICFDTNSNRTFYEVHGSLAGDCTVSVTGGVEGRAAVVVTF